MNPSASGWIPKYFTTVQHHNKEIDLTALYNNLLNCGFVYGSSVCILDAEVFANKKFTSEEITKINLLKALSSIYFSTNQELEVKDFINACIDFYNHFKEEKFSLFADLFNEKKNSSQLEKIISNRIQFDNNVFTKNFSNVFTNTLLFVDVLAFQNYVLNTTTDSVAYTKQLETIIESVVIATIKTKDEKSKYDKQLLRLFESSLRYHEYEQQPTLNYQELLTLLNTDWEKQYLIDITCMTVWDDKKLEINEVSHVHVIAEILGFEKETVNTSVLKVYDFFDAHKNELPFLNDPNPVKNFYDNSSQMVVNLITRNSKRLLLELSQSKELVVLLSQSTMRDLDKEEKQKVKEQLLDICKSIPSLAIFILPGGSVLLPLLIKFIPKLLPSAFDDNRIR